MPFEAIHSLRDFRDDRKGCQWRFFGLWFVQSEFAIDQLHQNVPIQKKYFDAFKLSVYWRKARQIPWEFSTWYPNEEYIRWKIHRYILEPRLMAMRCLDKSCLRNDPVMCRAKALLDDLDAVQVNLQYFFQERRYTVCRTLLGTRICFHRNRNKPDWIIPREIHL